jgi:hypothetical protein
MASSILWELWSDPTFPNTPMSPLPTFLAGALGQCSRVLCSNFTVSECITPKSKSSKQLFLGANVVAVPSGYELRSTLVAGQQAMVLVLPIEYVQHMVSNEAQKLAAQECDSSGLHAQNVSLKEKCWVYPGEHMSFATFISVEDEWPLAQDHLSDSNSLSFEIPVASALHLVGVCSIELCVLILK